MTEKELEKKIESTDKKLAKMKLPRGEGKITWKNKATCYLEYKKTLALRSEERRVGKECRL